MGVRRAWLGVVLLLLAAEVRASDHRFGTFFAPSYLSAKGSSLHLVGWHVQGEAALKGHEWLSFAGDLSVHFWGDGDTPDANPTQITFMVGPRISVSGGKDHHRKWLPFVQAMVLGAVYRSGASASEPSAGDGAFAVGAGVDRTLGGRNWAVRVQVDYIRPASKTIGDGVRTSAGAVYRFGAHH